MEYNKNIKDYKTTDAVIGAVLYFQDPTFEKFKNMMGERFGSIYTADLPHLTLILNPADPNDYEENFDGLVNLVSSFIKEPLKLKFSDVIFGDVNTYISMKVNVDKTMYNLHYTLLSHVNKYRHDYIREKDARNIRVGKYDESQINFIEKNGFLFAGENYDPHVTLGNF